MTGRAPDTLIHTAQAWLQQDPDPETREELTKLLAYVESDDDHLRALAVTVLEERFAGRLQFGTAGLRGPLGAGSTRMNRVVIAQTTAGFANYLRGISGAPSIVIGYDGRKNSRIFAHDAAAIMAGAGIKATVLPRALPTPVLAFAVRQLQATAGVMVTASHNPAADNGFKVYLGGEDDGAQIVSPQDAQIAAAIEQAAQASIDTYPLSGEYLIAGEAVVSEYVHATARRGAPGKTPMKVVYTALHGVGWATLSQVLAKAGFDSPVTVKEQQEPDPTFPTVVFPNPEEPGALDLAFATAKAMDADLVIANDPDADRLCVAIPTEDGWRPLTGNELGLLLGWRAASHAATRTDSDRNVLASSLVSSPGLAKIAEAYGLQHVSTLTGFKYISRVPNLRFGYEEALGYLVNPDQIHDKDGISAAVEFLSLAGELSDQGRTVQDLLFEMAETFGGYASTQVSLRVEDVTEIAEMCRRLRDTPPAAIGAHQVEKAEDFFTGVDGFPPSDILRYDLEGGARVIVRPSGTEPKLKVYIDARSIAGSGRDRVHAASVLAAQLAEDVRALLTGEH